MPTARYRLHRETPAVYEAVRWNGDNCAETFAFLGLKHTAHNEDINHEEIDLPADSQGRVGTAWLGDWILRNVTTGDFESYGDEDFHSDFEPDALAKFTWPESIGSSGATVLIPVNANGKRAGDLHLDLPTARLLQGALAGLIADLEFARRVAPNSPSWTGAGHE